MRGKILGVLVSLGFVVTLLGAVPARADDDLTPSQKAAAAAAYLNAICPNNRAKDAFNKRLGRLPNSQKAYGKPVPTSILPALKRLQRTSARAARILTTYAWPAALTYDAKSIAEQLYRESSEYGASVKTKTWTLGSSVLISVESSVASMRLYLDLPPANAPRDGC